jgi:hypothetical protein
VSHKCLPCLSLLNARIAGVCLTYSFFFFFSARDHTQGIEYARQVLYH